MPEIIVNEFGQKVKCYTWEEFQNRIGSRKKWTGKDDLNGKFLVVRHTWGIGDILYSTPAIHALKEKFPDVKIHYICTNPEVLEGNPDIEQTYHWMEFNDTMELGDRLQLKGDEWYWLDYDVPLKGGYDYKIHLRTKSHLNEFLVSLLRKDPRTLNGDERAFVDQASNSVITRYRLVALDMYCWHAYVDPPVKTVYYYPYDRELEAARNFIKPLKDAGKKVIALIPHSSTHYKNYPYWREVIKLCPEDYFWLVLDSFVRDSGPQWRGTNVQDCASAFTLRNSIAVTMEADLSCSSDTGIIYPRFAKGRPGVVTYGPHEPEPFLHHFQPQAHGLRIDRLKTTPGMEGMCSSACFIDTASCKKPGDYAPCLQELSPERVAQEVIACLDPK